MPKTFWEDWLWGPHDPKARSLVGSVSWAIVQSVYWEYLFLSYILFNAAVKLTDLRIQVRPVLSPFLPVRSRLLLPADRASLPPLPGTRIMTISSLSRT
jgi:hypothetical protein